MNVNTRLRHRARGLLLRSPMESGFEDLAAPAALDDAFREAEVNGGSAADATAAPAAVATAADAPAAAATAAAASAGAPSDGLDYAAIVHYGAHGVGVPGKIVRVHELVDGGDARQATALPLPIGSAHATAEPVYAAAEADAVLPADASSTAIVALTSRRSRRARRRRAARARGEHGHRARRAAATASSRAARARASRRARGRSRSTGTAARTASTAGSRSRRRSCSPARTRASSTSTDGRKRPRGRAPQGCHWDDSAGAWRDQYGAIVMPKKRRRRRS